MNIDYLDLLWMRKQIDLETFLLHQVNTQILTGRAG